MKSGMSRCGSRARERKHKLCAPLNKALYHLWLASLLYLAASASHEPKLHQDHPLRSNDYNPGLPDGCLTYDERFAPGLDPISSTHANTHHNFAIISWGLWHGQALLPDLIASLRVLALEGHRAGYDVWLMYRVDVGARLTLAEYKQMFPTDLQELVVIWDAEEVFALYDSIPDLPLFGPDPPDPLATGFTVMDLGYIPGTWLLHRFKAYDFAFMVESDVRYTGDWGKFLNAALNMAIAEEAADWPSLPFEVWGPTVNSSAEVSTALPDSLDGLPDLLNFLPIWRSNKWAHTRKNIADDSYDSLMMLWGGSRKLFDAMHKWSRQGKAAFYEAFMPTIAVSHSLKMQAISHPIWTHGGNDTWHCCLDAAKHVYDEWKRSGNCLHASLLHPIKLREAIWQSPADSLAVGNDTTSRPSRAAGLHVHDG